MTDERTEWQRSVLLETLELAVPLHMAELRDLPADTLADIAAAAGTTVGCHGDDLQFGGKHCAPTFNALARGLAATALTAWGGVTWQGLHWCTIPGCTSPDADHPQPHPTPPPPLPWHARPITDVHLPDPEAA